MRLDLLARVLNRGLGVEALDPEHAPGRVGGDPAAEIRELRVAGRDAELEGEPGVLTLVEGPEALALDEDSEDPFYVPGLALSARAMHLRWALQEAGYLKPAVFAPRSLCRWVKLVVFVPATHVEPVTDALAEAGAGVFERYDRCSFRAPGVGTFRGGAAARPYLGRPGVAESAEELRLEMPLPERLLHGTLEALLAVHPYDEPAYDVYPLLSAPLACGAGLAVRLADGDPRALCRVVGEAAGLDAALGKSLLRRERLVLVHDGYDLELPEAAASEARWFGVPPGGESPGGPDLGPAFELLLTRYLEQLLAPALASGDLEGISADA